MHNQTLAFQNPELWLYPVLELLGL